ncbi:MAG: efflux RND transporter periplasmic adaptor subunit [Rudaea sp.]
MSRSKWILTLIGVVILAIILWRVFGSNRGASDYGDAGANAAVPVTVVPATAQNVPVYLSTQGTVQPISTVNLQPQVGGQLLKLGFVEGKPVMKGQVLAEIDPRTLQAQLDQALAKRAQDATLLATAKANLERSESPQYVQYVAQIDRITQKNTVAQYQGAMAADDASIASTRVQLGFTKVTSPIDGVAGIRQVDPGNVITTTTTIVTVTQMHPIDALFSLAGTYLDEVRAAQDKAPLSVAVLDANNAVVAGDGTLKVIDNQIDPSSGQFKLKAEFPNADGRLYPGEYANIRLQVSVNSNALVVPTAAVQRGPNGEYVWLVTDAAPVLTSAQNNVASPQGNRGAARNDKPTNYVQMQPVTVGGEAGDNGLIVTKGLKAGALVVTAGQFRLKQGSKVLTMKPGEVPAPPTAEEIKQAAKSGGASGHGRH